MNYFVNIGSNLGNRRLNISRAVRRIMGLYGMVDMSELVESEPWGYESENRFVNMGLRFVSDDRPEDVLAALQGVEKELGGGPHRDADGGYCDRLVDIDIVAVDEMVIDEPGLKIPHPHLAEREFFLRPMVELAPIWLHPVTGRTCGEMLQELEASAEDAGA